MYVVFSFSPQASLCGRPDQLFDRYNSSPTFSPTGKLVAVHRKVHLFDIDIPGGITFKESDSLTGGDWQTLIDTGALPSQPLFPSASLASHCSRFVLPLCPTD